MPRKLKKFNGRAYCIGKGNGSIYLAAYSREDARRLIEEYCGRKPSVGEIRDYFSECWGDNMDGIAPERGIWLKDWNKPVERIY